MAMLFTTTDCGPSNPLQGLSKHFDRDRGITQDHFGSSSGPSKQIFRTPGSGVSIPDQDAASRFFSTAAAQFKPLDSFDLSTLHNTIPYAEVHTPKPSGTWANDFLQSSAKAVAPPTVSPDIKNASPQINNTQRDWHPSFQRMTTMSHFATLSPFQSPQVVHHDPNSWDKEFQFLQQSLLPEQTQVAHQPASQNADELARTAGLLLDTVKGEHNPKFKNSAFLGLMRQLRDHEVVVEGNQMVQNPGSLDVKGKGKAAELPAPHNQAWNALNTNNIQGIATSFREHGNSNAQLPGATEEVLNPDDKFWKQENADYINYWSEAQRRRPSEDASWHTLQEDWDQFEATATGIRPLNLYRFQENNPFLSGESSKTRTRNHLMHDSQAPFTQSVLESEAAVQRNITAASAWFELGVKQQENEREKKALQALGRAVQLDPNHLASWLALAVSYTNDGNRLETYRAIREWVQRNDKYQTIIQQYPEEADANASYSQQLERLVNCLIQMARSNPSEELDADIQIALAVLFNVNEEYDKAQDCFRAALAVRPQDWLLYNRVGATVANSGHPDEALQYYHQALQLNPVYIRARYNLGIACINLRQYDQAAHHILNALMLQDSDGMGDVSGLTSNALWDSLKTACIHMQRPDLASLCDSQDTEQFSTVFNM